MSESLPEKGRLGRRKVLKFLTLPALAAVVAPRLINDQKNEPLRNETETITNLQNVYTGRVNDGEEVFFGLGEYRSGLKGDIAIQNPLIYEQQYPTGRDFNGERELYVGYVAYEEGDQARVVFRRFDTSSGDKFTSSVGEGVNQYAKAAIGQNNHAQTKDGDPLTIYYTSGEPVIKPDNVKGNDLIAAKAYPQDGQLAHRS